MKKANNNERNVQSALPPLAYNLELHHSTLIPIVFKFSSGFHGNAEKNKWLGMVRDKFNSWAEYFEIIDKKLRSHLNNFICDYGTFRLDKGNNKKSRH